MPVGLSSIGGSEWKDLTGIVSLSGIDQVTTPLNTAGMKRLRIRMAGYRETNAADANDNVHLFFNGTDFNGLWTNQLNTRTGAGTEANTHSTNNNQMTFGNTPRHVLADDYYSLIDAIVYCDTANMGKIIVVSDSFCHYAVASPFAIWGKFYGIVDSTAEINEITIDNSLSANYDANSYYQVFGSKVG